MRHATRLVVAGASVLLSGCLATQSQLKHVSDVQGQQLANERAARAASDSALADQLGMVRGSVDSLRTDLATMRKEFGAKISMLEDGLHFAMPVNFDFNNAAVRTQDQPQLQRFAHIAQSYYPGSKITIEGFADPAGSTRYNVALSARRADAVRQYLLAQGLTGNDLATVGYGKTRLVVPGASHDQPGAELNRRVVFVIESRGQSTVAMSQDSLTSSNGR
ncbi:MAG TPA: OmpA family protein [Gemmatimonadaceae bacterium]|nr:OmpA family protein [Gemmatimonadaceae bacterium]